MLAVAPALAAPAQFGGPDEVRPRISARVLDAQGVIELRFQVADGYHITDLKNNFFAVSLAANEHAAVARTVFPAGVPYGEESVFTGEFSVRVFLKRPQGRQRPGQAGSRRLLPDLPGISQGALLSPRPEPGAGGDRPRFLPGGQRHRRGEPLARRLENLIRGRMGSASFLLFLLVFAAGFLASLTPCVYPVIPIVMGFVGGRSQGRKLKGFSLSLFFVLGLALVYSLLGVVAAKTGSLIGISFQNPVVVVAIAAIFIVMGLSLAGLFSITVPSWITAKASGSHKSEYLGAVVVGGVSAVIAAPCVGPVLIALLSWISQSGNVFLGFWLTFVFSLGMSVIFIVAGTFSGAIASLPRGGGWMSAVKYFLRRPADRRRHPVPGQHPPFLALAGSSGAPTWSPWPSPSACSDPRPKAASARSWPGPP